MFPEILEEISEECQDYGPVANVCTFRSTVRQILGHMLRSFNTYELQNRLTALGCRTKLRNVISLLRSYEKAIYMYHVPSKN